MILLLLSLIANAILSCVVGVAMDNTVFGFLLFLCMSLSPVARYFSDEEWERSLDEIADINKKLHEELDRVIDLNIELMKR